PYLDIVYPKRSDLDPRGSDLYPKGSDLDPKGSDLAQVSSHLGPRFASLLEELRPSGGRTIDFLVAVNQTLQQRIAYTIRLDPGVQTPEETLALGSGSCRDTSWLMVNLLRHMGVAARFVSGYLIQLTPDVKAIDGPSGTDTDFTDLHAWCEVFLPGAGWIGLDPTSGLLAGEGHIPVACTPSPSGAAPIDGALEACEVQFSHQMSVSRIHESARVTRPYTEAQWAAIDALGQAVDQELDRGDVRLTMGGEPTFVSDHDRDGAEWNTAALGPTKRAYAIELAQRLLAHYGPGGFLHLGQGKWYPGEQLPRWALSAFWRRDGQPCWTDPALLANEKTDRKRTTDDAQRFIEHLAARLGVDTRFVLPGHEDTLYYLWRERTLPVNVDPLDSRLDDELERARMRRVFLQGLGKVVGYALPLRAATAAAPGTAPGVAPAAGPGAAPGAASGAGLETPRWESGPWFLREGTLYLIPGDSPMGYRLPLDSLPWSNAQDRVSPGERDPFDPNLGQPLADPRQPVAGVGSRAGAGVGVGSAAATPVRFQDPHATPPARHVSAGDLTRTALCVEVRNPGRASGPKAEREQEGQGVLHVFMPPLARLEDYLALLAAVEDTAQALSMPVVIEGYPPPRDPRLALLQVTPDPGVIEVNIHPSASWGELVERTDFLYEAARQTRLSAEKFMLDGTHAGTGGGNHVVMGAHAPSDSPFLRRPDLLASLLSFWHNHPSLSYLFSGLFIGPTSQAPRIDEARNDQVYEVEIALRELERQMATHGECPPWLIDRALRNLLIDVTGNTHRSEFCIDKLYSPDGPSGRQGLLEMRAFEMPPHARMSLAQQLLLRALVAWFWREPYRGHEALRLTRWGTSLHDRFLLPTFVRLDFEDVISELSRAGFAFDAAWFEPHFEFRFPLIGQLQSRGIQLTLRKALEPWHVMGEEGAVGGTVRYVDSSLERLELKVRGHDPQRFVVMVNGVAAPLQPTGIAGESVIGVRYRAWHPASALHPTLGVDAPLTFDLVDRALSRSLGGCRYHVAHPGGRNYETFPINAYEAESRRLARFFAMGHTPGAMQVQATPTSPEFPFTLDLRRSARLP
ncbi:MAG: DUF2126 domain-containing protein, partial [Burkholderiaceae bacterium]